MTIRFYSMQITTLAILCTAMPASAGPTPPLPPPPPPGAGLGLGGPLTPGEKVVKIREELRPIDANLIREASEVLRWRDELAVVGGQIPELTREVARARQSVASQVAGDPALLPHLEVALGVVTELQDVVSFLVETCRQEQQEVGEALARADALEVEFKEPPSADLIDAKMALDEVLAYLDKVSRAHTALSLLKARRAGLNEELDQRLRLRKLEFSLPPLEEFGGDPALRKRTLTVREEAAQMLTSLKAYRKLLGTHLVSLAQIQLQRIRLEILEREEEIARLEAQRDSVFTRLAVSPADIVAAGVRVETAMKRTSQEARAIQIELKALRMSPPQAKGGKGPFTPEKEWDIRISALQHRLYLLDLEGQVETFRAAAMAALHPLLRLQPLPAGFAKAHARDLDPDKQVKAREELDGRREAWRHEYSQLSLEQPAPGEEERAALVLDKAREILDLYDRIGERKWEIEWCAELVRFHEARFEKARRGPAYYTWRIGLSVGLAALALMLSIGLGRATLGPIRKNPSQAATIRYALFGTSLLGMVVAWGGLALACMAFVWKIPVDWRVLGGFLQSTLFTIGDREVTVAAIGVFLGILGLTLALNELVGRFVKYWAFAYFTWDEGVRHALLAVVRYLILFIGIALGLEFIGIGMGALAIFAGVIGIGIGFGLQSIASNFISGLIILFERPIKKGDYIRAGDLEGRVELISARATTLTTRDNISVIVPNSEFISGRVVNLSHGSPTVQLHLPLGVAYGSELARVDEILLAVAAAHPDILDSPDPKVLMTAFGESSLNLELLVWTENVAHKGLIISALYRAIDAAFREHGIEVPFPQRDYRVRGEPLP